MADRTSQLLNLFGQSYAQGVGLANQQANRFQQQRQFDEQMKAQQGAQSFREKMAMLREGRAQAQEFRTQDEYDFNASLRDFQRQLAESKARGAQVQAGQAEYEFGEQQETRGHRDAMRKLQEEAARKGLRLTDAQIAKAYRSMQPKAGTQPQFADSVFSLDKIAKSPGEYSVKLRQEALRQGVKGKAVEDIAQAPAKIANYSKAADRMKERLGRLASKTGWDNPKEMLRTGLGRFNLYATIDEQGGVDAKELAFAMAASIEQARAAWKSEPNTAAIQNLLQSVKEPKLLMSDAQYMQLIREADVEFQRLQYEAAVPLISIGADIAPPSSDEQQAATTSLGLRGNAMGMVRSNQAAPLNPPQERAPQSAKQKALSLGKGGSFVF